MSALRRSLTPVGSYSTSTNQTSRLVEVDEDTTAYERGHIRNAVGWNWFFDLHDALRRDYVDQEALSRLLQQAGVDPESTVVLYGGNNNWFAAHAY
jgi:thiosulfate/3-mercaptopyruvate sulfurtransferase